MSKLGRKNYEIAYNYIFDRLNSILNEHPIKYSLIIKNENRIVDNITVDKINLGSVIERYVYDILNYALGYNDYIDYWLYLEDKQVSFNAVLREHGFCI